jgi:alkyldihydroxyacetonephosphate synthase
LSLVKDLTALLGPGCASADPADLWAASRDCWPKTQLWTKAGRAPHPPDAVVWPRDAAEVQKIVRFAVTEGAVLVPFAAGSGVCGGALPIRGGLALDVKRLGGSPKIDLEARTVDVDAGVNGQRLEELLNAAGATLGHFPSSIYCSTVGGWLAARSAGQLSSKYGKIEDMVLSMEVVDGTGEVIRTVDGPTAGPDLNQLFVGSEGTLGVITRAKLRIWPKPTGRWFRGVLFKSLEKGMEAMHALMRAGLRPAVARLYDPFDTLMAGKGGGDKVHLPVPAPLKALFSAGQREALRFALKAPLMLNRLVDAIPAGSLLILGFEGEGEHGVDDARAEGEEALRLCREAGGDDLGAGPGEKWLTNRYKISYRQAPLFAAGAFVDTMEVATTWDRLPRLYEAVRRAVAHHAFILAHFSHAYLEGCSIYFTFIGPGGQPTDETARALSPQGTPSERVRMGRELGAAEKRYDECWKAALSAVCDEGATLSHHHGVGLSKQSFLPREHGEGMRQLRALKRAFDPHGVMNPGKLLL